MFKAIFNTTSADGLLGSHVAIYLSSFLCFVFYFVLSSFCVLCPRLPMSLDCPIFIAPFNCILYLEEEEQPMYNLHVSIISQQELLSIFKFWWKKSIKTGFRGCLVVIFTYVISIYHHSTLHHSFNINVKIPIFIFVIYWSIVIAMLIKQLLMITSVTSAIVSTDLRVMNGEY